MSGVEAKLTFKYIFLRGKGRTSHFKLMVQHVLLLLLVGLMI